MTISTFKLIIMSQYVLYFIIMILAPTMTTFLSHNYNVVSHNLDFSFHNIDILCQTGAFM